MITQIRVYPRIAIEDAVKGSRPIINGAPWHLISIYTLPENLLMTEDNRHFLSMQGAVEFLSLRFWDIDEKTFEKIRAHRFQEKFKHAKLFEKWQAVSIIQFLKDINKRPEEEILAVHCDAGISRSGAVGSFACDFFRLDYNEFKAMNPNLLPNAYVSKVLREEAGMTPLFIY